MDAYKAMCRKIRTRVRQQANKAISRSMREMAGEGLNELRNSLNMTLKLLTALE